MAKNKAPVFVPADEQPYPIPDNWCWVKLHFVCEYLKAGGDKPASFVEKKDKEHLIPVVANGIQNEGIIGFTDIGQISAGTVSVSGRGTIGYSFFREYEYVPVVRLIVIKPRKNLLPHYLKFIFDVFEEKGTGSSIPQLTVPMIKDKIIPLPPLAEQLRIVGRIESLFAKLDEAKEKAQAVVDGFALRKSAILHKAFTGELTERWRKKHGVGLESWKDTTLSEIVSGFKYGTSEKSTYNNKGMPVLRIPNVGTGTLSFEDMKYLAHNDIDEANQVHENDLLIIRSNGSRDLVGKCAIVPALSRKFAYASFLIRIKPSERILPDYLAFYLNSTDARTQMFKKAKSSAGIHNINSQELGSITINVPTIYEQSAIIAVLNNLLAKEQQAKQAAEAVIARIDTMKKAVLGRAFRGELGTNNPEEEWAGELVKAALQDKK